jgi:hypothetical protein
MGVPISNVTRRVVYAASGTGPYAFTFEILANTDIAVYRDDTLLTLTTNYTVTINPNGTGSITLTAAPTGATQIAIVGDRSIQRMTDFVTGGDFFANTVNDEMDQQTIFAQQNAEAVNRALQAPPTDPTNINMTLPRASQRAGRYLGFDASGNPIADGDIPDTIYFGPSSTNPTTRSNGTPLQNGDIYFNTASNELRVYNAVNASWFAVMTSDDVLVTKTGVATAGQTTFTFAGGYRVGTLNVYINGVLLQPADYTATNGTTIVFGSALSLNDEILVQSFKAFSSLSIDDITNLRQEINTSAINAVAALNIDCSLGNYFTKTIAADSTFTFSNAPASRYYAFTLKVVHTSGVITWPASVRWVGGVSAPALTTGKTHMFMISTDDGGTNWRGASMANFTG